MQFPRRLRFACLLGLVFLLNAGSAFSQQSLAAAAPRLARGIQLYGEGKWGEAIIELRQSQSETREARLRAEAQFWIAICELQAGDYERALHDIDEFQRIDPKSPRIADAPYHKARALFYLKRYNEALPLFKTYADSIRIDGRYADGVRANDWTDAANALDSQDNYNRKASAIYWIGECLYALEQYNEAETVFTTIITQYIRSHKYEASVNRISLIKEKRIQSGLLDIVKQNPAAGGEKVDAAVSNYQQQLGSILDTGRILIAPGVSQPQSPSYDPAKLSRLLALKTTALEMMDRLVSLSNNYDVLDGAATVQPSAQTGGGRITTWQ